MTTSVIGQIDRWFATAYPSPTAGNRVVQLGVHFEEVHEMLLALNPKLKTEPHQEIDIHELANEFKKAGNDADLQQAYVEYIEPGINHVELLDALCDQIVTALGVAHTFGYDIQGALREVANSNDSKFAADFTPIFDVNGKITKGPHYRKANLLPFIFKKATTK